jgi:hypothetical protein
MKVPWSTPGLTVFGPVAELTLGSAGTLPDLNASLNVVNNSCPTQTFVENGRTITRRACINADAVQS